jgi:hypothetical protein
MVYLIPVSGRIIQGLISSVPATAGAKGVIPAIIKIAIALVLWGILYLIFGGRKKKAN